MIYLYKTRSSDWRPISRADYELARTGAAFDERSRTVDGDGWCVLAINVDAIREAAHV
jgi:hypothetical protein